MAKPKFCTCCGKNGHERHNCDNIRSLRATLRLTDQELNSTMDRVGRLEEDKKASDVVQAAQAIKINALEARATYWQRLSGILINALEEKQNG